MGMAQADESGVLKKLSLPPHNFPALSLHVSPHNPNAWNRLLQKEAVKFRQNPDKIYPFYVSQKSTTNYPASSGFSRHS